MAAYRAARRVAGKDQPRTPRTVDTDGHIGNDWFRANVWRAALEKAQLGFHVTPHGLRYAHASWLLAGGADLQVVKERLGHGSITTTGKYLHTLPDPGGAALNALAAVRGSRTAATEPAVLPQQRSSDLTEMAQLMARFKELYESLSGGDGA